MKSIDPIQVDFTLDKMPFNIFFAIDMEYTTLKYIKEKLPADKEK